jgi:NO-binding membrane sensor protein with MHYT domain
MSSAVQTRLPGVINIILALWLLLGSFIGGFGNIPSKASDVILGFFLAFLSMHRAIPTEDSRWMSLVSIVIGGAAIAAPFVFSYSDLSSPTTNNIIVGMLIVVVSAWGYVAAPSESAA